MATVLGIYSNILENKNKKYSSLHHHLKIEKQIFDLSHRKMRIVSLFFVLFCSVLFRFFFHSQPCLFTVQTEPVQIWKSQDAQSRTRSTVPFSPPQSCSALGKLQPPSEIKTPNPDFLGAPWRGRAAPERCEQQQRWSTPSTRSASTKNIPRVLEFHLKAKKKKIR